MPRVPGPVEQLPVSVVIPAYRRADAVRRAVAGVRAQTGAAPAEVIVVDDASGDDTADAARAAGATVLVNAVNRGEGGARNAGIEAATQPWVALLDSDDEWLPWHLAALWPLRGSHVLVGAACIGTGAGPSAGRIWGHTGRRPLVLRSPADLAWPENVVTPSGALIRRDAMLAAGGFPEHVRAGVDVDGWWRLLEHGTGLASPGVSVLYHLHPDQVSAAAEGMRSGHLERHARYADRPWFDPHLPERFAAVSAWDRRARGELARTVLSNPRAATGLARTLARRARKRRASTRAEAELAARGIAVRR